MVPVSLIYQVGESQRRHTGFNKNNKRCPFKKGHQYNQSRIWQIPMVKDHWMPLVLDRIELV
jgi:hypothetical protein